jgi:transcriptional regulator with XRE-family HTH domain
LKNSIRRARTRAEDDQIGRAIRAVRLGRRLTLATVAHAAGISVPLLCLIEQGERRLYAGDLMRLARVLQCDPSVLVGRAAKTPSTGILVDYAGALEGLYLIPHLADVALLTPAQRDVLAGLLKSWLPEPPKDQP